MQQPTYIIAEAGVNHDGNIEKARALIDIAVAAKADAVKFQLFDPAALVTATAPTATYQAHNLGDGAISQHAMLARLVLPENAFAELCDYCTSKNIDFLCTPFDAESLVYLLANTCMPFLKLASGEVTNGPLLLAAARSGLPVILSTGMSNLDEIGIALSILHTGYFGTANATPTLSQPTPEMLQSLREKVTLLHCVSQYPAPLNAMNLRAMATLQSRFNLAVGLSDHSLGITIATAAVALGATMIEKHFTYDVKASGPDHAASLTPHQLTTMVAAIREVEQGLGNPEKHCVVEETNTREIARRSLVAATSIAKGATFSEQNLIAKRPATGPLAPNHYWQLLGRPAKRAYAPDESIHSEELE